MSNRLLLIQPGAFGDLFICAPIAKHYADLGHEVIWPTTKKYANIIGLFSYVTHLELDERELHSDWLRSDTMKTLELIPQIQPDLILNLADRGPHPTAELPWEKFEETKYRLAGLDFRLKHNLEWSRNIEKENEIYDHFVGDEKDYILAHLTSSNNDKAELPKNLNKKIIELQEFKDDNIVGWYKVIKNASAIYCVESSIHCFIDGFVKTLNCEKYLLSRPTLQRGQTYTVSNYWEKKYLK
tara:strand:- start:665 stop:1387 length:723 start_codon:yes stop_codon:yes gene_type:complete